jgi:hypothetical protein
MIPIYEIIRTRRKSIAIIVQRDGRLTVRAPLRTSEKDIHAIVERKADWIRAKQEWVKTMAPAAKPKEYADGGEFWYLGKVYPLVIVRAASPALSLQGSFFLSRAALPEAEAVFKVWYRKQARRVITERVRWHAQKLGFTYQKVRITSARTRWGSCSARGTLSFTWRLVMAPLPVIDYVVVHELVHTQVRNHSKAFWNRLGLALPAYKTHVQWLKVNGHLLSLD